IRGPKPWGKNTIQFKGKHVTDAITDLSLDWMENEWDQSKPFFLMHHYKAPHDYFDNAPRYESYLADVDIPSPASLWEMTGYGSLATRGDQDELV
ncbi:MAG TPA: acetylglucosamine-6-sulfatase, partial [Planctomycetaceae bacterium]|nr:acetylglucosamine-6-sulfatase [Planctomycetaceae bacterium]